MKTINFTCDLQLIALNISKNTKHVNVIVVSLGVILLSLIYNIEKECEFGENKHSELQTRLHGYRK